MKRHHRLPFGAEIMEDCTRFRLWAPDASEVAVCLMNKAHRQRITMSAAGDGWYESCAAAAPGTRYFYEIDRRERVPDPASRFQPDDAHGASTVIDPYAYEWRDESWGGHPWNEVVVYELHVGTCSGHARAGRFDDVRDRLDGLADLGITAIELMPVADFPGRWNWGYDGVLPFAPDHTYGTPESLKALVDAAHARGLMVFLDVVYNHFGPEACFTPIYASAFTRTSATPWGRGFNFDPRQAAPVRQFVTENALYWLEEFHMDGLRIDAPQAIHDASRPHILEELAHRVEAGPGRNRHIHLMLEHPVPTVDTPLIDGYVAAWDDDVHHALHVALTGECHSYYSRYAEAPVAHLVDALSAKRPSTAVVYLQNHDQVGNRARGERIGTLVHAQARRAATALLLMSPCVPLLFMGEEWDSERPFPFFCDFAPEMSRSIAAGRKQEFALVPGFDEDMPDPGDPGTFYRALMLARDADTAKGRAYASFYRELLARRKCWLAPRIGSCGRAEIVRLHGACAFSLGFPCGNERLWLCANLSAQPAVLDLPIPGRWIYPEHDPTVQEHGLQILPAWSVICTVEAMREPGDG